MRSEFIEILTKSSAMINGTAHHIEQSYEPCLGSGHSTLNWLLMKLEHHRRPADREGWRSCAPVGKSSPASTSRPPVARRELAEGSAKALGGVKVSTGAIAGEREAAS